MRDPLGQRLDDIFTVDTDDDGKFCYTLRFPFLEPFSRGGGC